MKGETNRFKTENGGKTLSELKNEREGQRFSTEKLLKSRYLENYQPDFAKIILSKPAYTISEAIETLERTLKGDI